MQEGTQCHSCGGKLQLIRSGKYSKWGCMSCGAEADADAHRDRDIINNNQNKKEKVFKA